MLMPIGGAAVETFSTPPSRNSASRHVEENSSHQICLLKLIFAHLVTCGDINSNLDFISYRLATIARTNFQGR